MSLPYIILSKLYNFGVRFRHFLFNCGALKSESFDIPIVCVGNVTVGGSGKTPMCELLIEHYSQKGRVALLSRGYGRTSRGYREVSEGDSYLLVGDEPLQMKMKYPEALVVVCEKRVVGIRRILKNHPEVKMIVMDDGFQHRYVMPKVNVIMVDYNRPISLDKPLPLGSLRDDPAELHRANIFVVTKCPEGIKSYEMGLVERELGQYGNQKIFFTKVNNLPPRGVFGASEESFNASKGVVALAGIGNPDPFFEMAQRRYGVVERMVYPDHHSYCGEDITRIVKALNSNPEVSLLTTEKDAVKLLRYSGMPEDIKSRIFFTKIEMEFIKGTKEELIENIDDDIRKD